MSIDRIQAIDAELLRGLSPHGGSLVSYPKLSLPDRAYVFFFLGGNGIAMGLKLYELLRRSVAPEELRKKVRFQFYDCHKEHLDSLVDSGQISSSERVFVPCDGVYASLMNDPYLRAWAGEDFCQSIHAADFNDSGACAKRKVSSVRFLNSACLEAFRKRLSDDLAPLDKYHSLSIYMISGTGGGTGSGLLIPITMAARTFIRKHALHPTGTVNVTNVLLSPSTIDHLPGNCRASTAANRTALLKELSWLNRCVDTGETVRIPISSTTVLDNLDVHGTPAKLFDATVMVEGISDGAVLERPSQALEIAANHIFHEMTDPSGQLQQALFSNVETTTSALLRANTAETFPRNTLYDHIVIGNAIYYLPRNELCGFIGQMVYKDVLRDYTAACSISDAYIQNTLKTLKLLDADLTARIKERPRFLDRTPKNQLYASNGSAILRQGRETIDQMCKQALFTKGQGVAWAVNFTGKLGRALRDQADHYHLLLQDPKPANRPLYQMAYHICEKLSEHLTEHCHKAFTLTEAFVRTFSDVLEEYTNICTDVQVFDDHLSRTLCWSNSCLAQTDPKTPPVLLSLINQVLTPQRTKDLVDSFRLFLAEHMDKWVTLLTDNPCADPTADFRAFMEEHFVGLLDESFESLVIKLFAEDPAAKVLEADGNGNLVVSPHVQTAAQKIYHTCKQKGAYLAKLHSKAGGTIHDYSPSLVLLVPASCEHLLTALKNEVPHGIQVVPSQENNQIALTTFYSGLPLYKFESLEDAQRAYHDLAGMCGLHLLEGSDWPSGYDLPNPIPANLQEALGVDKEKTFAFERTLHTNIQKALEQARDPRFDLAQLQYATVGGKEVYRSALLRLLPGQDGLFRPDVQAEADAIWNRLHLDADEIADGSLSQVLEQHGLSLDTVDTFYPNMVTSTIHPPAGFDWEITAQSIRCRVPLMHRLLDTAAILALVQEKLTVHNASALARAAQRKAEEDEVNRIRSSRIRFARLWIAGVITCEDEESQRWLFRLPARSVPLYEADPMDNVELRYPHYFAWRAMEDKLADPDLDAQVNEVFLQADNDAIRQRKPLLRQTIQDLLSAHAGSLAFASSRFDQDMASNGHSQDTGALVEFYTHLVQLV